MNEPRRPLSPRSGHRLWVICSMLLACDIGTRPALAESPEEPSRSAAEAPTETREAADHHAGVYRFAGGQAERDAVEAAIESIVAEMSPFARGIARERLRETNRVPDRVVIERDGDVLAIAFDERRYEAPLDGSKTKVEGITGDTLDYHVSVTSGRIRQTFVGPKGGRKNEIRKRGERGLGIAVTVTSDSLPRPLEYRLSLKRAE